MKKYIIAAGVVLVAMQAFQIHSNKQNGASPNHITTKYEVPIDVMNILQRSCYDCHSNNTVYPWYSYVQPVGFWLNHHINEGKEKLNFSEFATYKPKRAAHKLEEIVETITEGEMPIGSYLWTHKASSLNKDEIAMVKAWADSLRNTIVVE